MQQGALSIRMEIQVCQSPPHGLHGWANTSITEKPSKQSGKTFFVQPPPVESNNTWAVNLLGLQGEAFLQGPGGKINLAGSASRLESSRETSPALVCSPVPSGREQSPAREQLSSSSILWHQPIRKEGFVDQPSTLGNETGCAQKLPQGSISTGRSFLQPGRSQRMLLLAISSCGAGEIVWDRVLAGLVHEGRKG